MQRIFVCIFICHTVVLHGQQRDVPAQIDSLMLAARYQDVIALVGVDASPLLQNKKAEALTRLGKLHEAETILMRLAHGAGPSADPVHRAVTLANTGFLQLHQGRPDLAATSLEQAVTIFESSGHAHSTDAASAIAHLGLVYTGLGKYEQAAEQLHMALAIRQQADHNAEELVAATYNDLGLVYSQTDKDKALDYYERAQALYEKQYGKQHPKIAISAVNIGVMYRDLDLLGDAVNNFENALKIWDVVYPGSHPAKGIALYNLGQTYLQMNDYHAAMGYYERAYHVYQESYGDRHPEIAYVLNAIGNLQVARARYADALHSYQRALQANVQGFASDDIMINPPLRHYYHGTRLLHTLLFKAQALEARYFGRSLKFSDLQGALAVLEKCDSLIDEVRQHSTHEQDKLALSAIATEVYSDGVRIAYEAARNAVAGKLYLEKAFYFAEKSKSAVLLEAISDAHAKSYAGIPDTLLEQEKFLKSAITLTAQQLAQRPPAETESTLRQTLFAQQRAFERFTATLEHNFPGYYNLKFNTAPPTISQLQEKLSPHTALVSYFSDEKNNQLYTFVVRQKKFSVFLRTLPPDFDKYLTGLINGLYFQEINTFKKSAYELGRYLLPPLPSAVHELVIIPTGRLGTIPFETLLTGKAKEADAYAGLPYLLNRYPVRYEFSAGLILQKKQSAFSGKAGILLCAPVEFPDQARLGQLPATEQEVKEIAALFSGHQLKHAAYTRDDAAEELVKNGNLRDFAIIHLATHGVVDETRPELSRLFLRAGTDGEDGNLYAGEIYNLELRADLVTLSACQTGLGKIQKGEGVIGLSRALVYAGARKIVVSFWNVADESTAQLMKRFYGHVLENPQTDFSSALRKAKLSLLNSPQLADPYYWAPFVLIGF